MPASPLGAYGYTRLSNAGAALVIGAFLARAFVERMPVQIHTAILDAAVMVGGAVMIVAALRH